MTTVALASLAFSVGCSDLGTCDDPAKGRTTVLYGTQLYFTGQAILTNSCTQGCHQGGAEGQVRRGAPADLNFDLKPLTPGPVIASGASITGVQIDPLALKAFRARQRKVYEQRANIWAQVQDGLMPPSNASSFEDLTAIVRTMFGADGKCTGGGQALTTLGKDKEELRKWLACGTPVIETNSKDLPYKATTSALPEDMAAGSVYYATDASVGYQYPSCSGGGGSDGGAAVSSFSEIYTGILKPNCAVCHPVSNAGVDFTTEDTAYTSLLGANGQGKPQLTLCAANPVPYVTPGDPSKSYLLAKMDKSMMSGPHCDTLMPQPLGSDADAVAKVRAWIQAGALRRPAAAGAGDAGTPDAGP